MRTFAELLTEHMRAAGISDAELARRLGVRRQTIFRWKEGTVARPRSREDVLACASRLRLTDAQRDELLVAAGFRPEGEAANAHDSEAAGGRSTTLTITDGGSSPRVPEPETVEASSALRRSRPQISRRLLVSALVGLVIVAGAALLAAWLRTRMRSEPVAGPGETLVVIAPFVNYAGGQLGYNVAGRLQTVLEEEIRDARLDGVKVAIWPQEIKDAPAAQAAATRSGASLIVWGEYDSGRVLTRFTASRSQLVEREHRDEDLLGSPDELAITINASLPAEVRHVTLLTLAQLAIESGADEQARALLVRAQANPPAAPDARASLAFWLGYVYQTGRPVDLEQAIRSYSQALELRPDFASAYANRGSAYLRRVDPGDIERAIADLDRAIELGPSAPAYFNRGLAALRQGARERWVADLKAALELDPQHAGALAALCWGYGLDQEPETALPYCEQAVTLDPSASNRDSRGLVYAELGRYVDAIADFEAFLTWLDRQPPEEYEHYAPRRRAWLQALQAGRDPFDRATLEQLRME